MTEEVEQAGAETLAEEKPVEEAPEETGEEQPAEVPDETEQSEETETEEEAPAPSEEEGYHKDPKIQKYLDGQKAKAVAEARLQWDAEHPAKEEQPQPVSTDKVDAAEEALAKAYEDGDAKTIARKQRELNQAQLESDRELQARAYQERQIKLQATDKEITRVKTKLTADGVKNVEELDDYIDEINHSGTIEDIYRRALKFRGMVKAAEARGEKVGLKKTSAATPGRPSSSTTSGYRPGMTFNEIENASRQIPSK